MIYLKDPLAIFFCTFSYIKFSKAQPDKETGWLRRRGHSSGILMGSASCYPK